ncbi:MAG TPA: hypothetical protein VEA80_06345 [Vitreimonas sp.]|nr:hypothetical protein [Vitreimonas sp.]
MRRFLLATVAIAALALAAPMAGAQYTEPPPSNPVYSSPSDPAMDEEQTPLPNATPPVDSQTNAAPATTTQSNNTPLTTDTTTPYAQQTQSDPQMNAAPTQQAQANDPYAQPAQPYADGVPATTDTAAQDATMQAQATDPYAQPAQDQYAMAGADITMSPSMVEHAQEAGMDGVPMTAAEVCAPREISLAQGTSRLNHAARNQLEFAADRASACETQRVLITAPDGRASAVRETLVDHGFDDTMIEVQRADELGVELTFAGVATSSAEYAAIFNAPQFASASQTPTTMQQPSSYAPTAAPESGYQQTSYNPNSGSSYTSTTAPYSSTTTSDMSSPGYAPGANTYEDSATAGMDPATDTVSSADDSEEPDTPDPLY